MKKIYVCKMSHEIIEQKIDYCADKYNGILKFKCFGIHRVFSSFVSLNLSDIFSIFFRYNRNIKPVAGDNLI